jgi:pilus assembly protein CpaB
MKTRSLVLLVISLLLGILAVYWVRGSTGSTEAASRPAGSVVVARVRLNFGDRLRSETLREVPWPDADVPPGSFPLVNELLKDDRVVLRGMDPGEPVLAGKISGSGGRATLSSVIDKDMRAVTIRVNDVNGVAGFVLPGDRVDILLTRDSVLNQQDSQTDVILQNTKVLGVDQDANERRDQPTVVKAVTLEVTPDDAQKLTLGQKIGLLSLVLRNLTDPTPVETRSVSLQTLLGGTTEKTKGKPHAKPASDGPVEIEIYRGTDPTRYQLHGNGSIKETGGKPKLHVPDQVAEVK